MYKSGLLLFVISGAIFAMEKDNIEYVKEQRNYPDRTEVLDGKTIEANSIEANCLLLGHFFCKPIIKTVGYIMYDTQICRIDMLRVNEKYRRRGIGSELVKRALEDMEPECRCSDIRLVAVNPASQALFSKLGAQRINPKYYQSMFFEKKEECSRFEELLKNFSKKL